MRLTSVERYRASAAERRRHGGSIVTKYLVTRPGFDSFYVWGYGKTQHDRKKYAKKSAQALILSGGWVEHKLPHLAAK